MIQKTNPPNCVFEGNPPKAARYFFGLEECMIQKTNPPFLFKGNPPKATRSICVFSLLEECMIQKTNPPNLFLKGTLQKRLDHFFGLRNA